jgi:DNA-binding PadR family transcriptional regulator
MEKGTGRMRKIFANHDSGKRLISKVYKELKLNGNNSKHSRKKWAKDLNRHCSKKDIPMSLSWCCSYLGD